MNKMTEHLGKRVLIKLWDGGFEGSPREATILEVSSSGKYVQLRYPSGFRIWELATSIKVLEVLD